MNVHTAIRRTDGKFSYDAKLREQAMKGTNGDLVYPEMTKDTILFGGTRPRSLLSHYAIFCDSFIPHDCQLPKTRTLTAGTLFLSRKMPWPTALISITSAAIYLSQQIDPPFQRTRSHHAQGSAIT